MKTIEHKGKVYQKGTVYEFSDDDGETWCVEVLEDIYQAARDYPYKTRSVNYRLIRASRANLGTITETPVELIHGECYQFLNPLNIWSKGFFLAEYGRLYCTTGAIIDPSKCSNIKLLTVGEQNENN